MANAQKDVESARILRFVKSVPMDTSIIMGNALLVLLNVANVILQYVFHVRKDFFLLLNLNQKHSLCAKIVQLGA